MVTLGASFDLARKGQPPPDPGGVPPCQSTGTHPR